MTRNAQRSAEEEARLFYLTHMDDYVSNNFEELCSNMFEVKQKHFELRFKAVDILRNKAETRADTWKLERDIEQHYSFYLTRLRKRNSLTNSLTNSQSDKSESDQSEAEKSSNEQTPTDSLESE